MGKGFNVDCEADNKTLVGRFQGQGLPEEMIVKGTDCESCFCHWHASLGQLQTFADHMNTQYLTRGKVEATVSLDMRAKRTAVPPAAAT